MPAALLEVQIRPRAEVPDPAGPRLAERLRRELGLAVADVAITRVYRLEGPVDGAQAAWIATHLLADPVTEAVGGADAPAGAWTVEVAYRPGVTDNEGTTAEQTVQDAVRAGLLPVDGPVRVRSARRFQLAGGLTEADARRVGARLANPLVQDVRVWAAGETPPAAATTPWPAGEGRPTAAHVEVPLPDDDEALVALSRKGLLSLSLDEMRAIRAHFEAADVRVARTAAGLPAGPTDVELEAIAQTWSEHCKHKIFASRIRYRTGGTETEVDGLFKTFIRGATERVAQERDWLVSVFTDNAGVIRWSDRHHLVFKAETHNAPSALEPYGGALTGIVGVNRDPAGTGLGAKLIFNTDVFCFADPAWAAPLPPGVLHPARIFEGVRLGVEHGGNQSGVPTVNGGLFFDDRYLGRPLVFCGTGALMPVETGGTPTHLKEVRAGDLVVMAGGRVGRDGIHGATFSSAAIDQAAPVGVVQIGDPITQKRLLDLLAEAREAGLYRTLTDNGAGGLSSSVGEMAEMSGGAVLALDAVPLKAPGLAPWEVLVSESQERMTLAVPPDRWEALQELARRREVEVSAIGRFSGDGCFTATWHGEPVMALPLAFLHGGWPRRTLEAEWEPAADVPEPACAPRAAGDVPPFNPDLFALLGSLNICSREAVIRQYDHEVQAATVVKPLVGVACDGPSDAAVLRPDPDSDLGVVVSCALDPHLGDRDPYAMAACAVDEAIRNAVAVGADPDHLALLDNFCWPDPVFDADTNPDGRRKLGALVRTCQGLHDAVVAFGAPLISGKDSMKNDYRGPDGKISVPPTLLVSAIARHPGVRRAVTMDAKAAGDLVYVLGMTRDERGGSQHARLRGWTGGQAPSVDFGAARERYRKLHEAIHAGLVASCHDASEGGLAVAFAETAFAGGFGLRIDATAIPIDGEGPPEALLFGESASRLVVTVAPEDASAFEATLAGTAFAPVGVVMAEPRLEVLGPDGSVWIDAPTDALKSAWTGGLSW